MWITHGIDIVQLHQSDILLHQLFADSTSQLRMFMPVGSLHQHRYTIDAETSVLDLRSTETHFATGNFRHPSSRIFQFQHERIEIGVLGTPSLHVFQALFTESDEVTQPTWFDRHFARKYGTSGCIIQSISYRYRSIGRSLNGNIESEDTIFVTLLLEGGIYFIVGNVLLRSTI